MWTPFEVVLFFSFRRWGGPVGYVYQKAYLEFFCSPQKLNALVEKCKSFPFFTYMAVNKDGTWFFSVNQTDVNAVTWGVFPAKEIIQPTVVDAASFLVWKDEAFETWSRGWAKLYPEAAPRRYVVEERGGEIYREMEEKGEEARERERER
ncbi:unnamed protein product [Fraxinus pennsylvanica]|uniref:MTHFR SAM-binding regulatory domain-containing protein n=1 Tax=Fraxinus pennsylvanica TaxID=56036 RepID=A0AAD2DQ53_9LAMI|nr:unnamed protein product [Fraxinus pennsylvanica]